MIIKETDAPDFACCRNPAEACVGASCMAWRWRQPLATDPGWKEAVAKIAEETGEKAPYAKAAARVAANPDEFGQTPTKGYCGLAGKP